MCTVWITAWGSRAGVDGRSENTVGTVSTGAETSVKSRRVVWSLLIALIPTFVSIVLTLVGITRDTWIDALDSISILSLLIMLTTWAIFEEAHHERLDAGIDADTDEDIDADMNDAGGVEDGGEAGSSGKGLTRP